MLERLRQLDFICVGAPSAEYRVLCDDYEQRISRYLGRSGLRIHEVKGTAIERGIDVAREEEASRIAKILDGVASGAHVIVFDERGATPNTPEFAEMLVGEPHVAVVIGGAAGLAPTIVKRASARVALGRMTMPHQLARLAVTEQIYRAFRIARSEPYHL